MTTTTSGRRTAVLLAAAIALALTLTPLGGLQTASAAGKTTTIRATGSADFFAAVRALRAGDTLRLSPGTYDIGRMKPPLSKGTATAPIRITAADPARPPVIRGHLIMEDAEYWTLTRLKMVGTSRYESSLKMAGGRGWAVAGNEFTGAATTQAHANVVIDNNRYTGSAPVDWQFSFNCVHDASARPAGSTAGYHNIYVVSSGGARGLIARNSLFNAPAGSNIKVGIGADPRAGGASGVRIENNTMYNANNQVLLFGNIAGIVVRKNMFVYAQGNVKTGVYLSSIRGDGRLRVTSTDNYSARMVQSTFVLNSAAHTYVDRGNVLGSDPRVGPTCAAPTSGHGAVSTHGRWATR